MGGVYGILNSRADFFRVLDEARQIASRMLEVQPKNGLIASIATQLAAMQRWSADGRDPLADERKTITIGLLAVRQLDADRQDEAGELARKLTILHNYFDEWPSDEAAANATDADYWKRFGL
ncbi:MAG: hypothetical protein M3680_18750 [Myxococcota bacterium]|nr:hypothetical protein [Myxococcota bacterium]